MNNQDSAALLSNDPKRLTNIESQRKSLFKDGAAVKRTQWALLNEIKETELSSGGKTKWQRSRLDIAKPPALNAVGVGDVAAVEEGQNPPW